MVLALQNVAIFGPKILAVLKRRGKNFGGVFFGSFQQSEQESEKISALVALLAEITNLLPLVVRNCSPARDDVYTDKTIQKPPFREKPYYLGTTHRSSTAFRSVTK